MSREQNFVYDVPIREYRVYVYIKENKRAKMSRCWGLGLHFNSSSCTQNSNCGTKVTNRKVDERLILIFRSTDLTRGTINEDFSHRHRRGN